MKRRIAIVALMAAALLSSAGDASQPARNWTHFVRIAGHSLNRTGADEIVRSATGSQVLSIASRLTSTTEARPRWPPHRSSLLKSLE